LRKDAENLLGADFSDVRLHVGPEPRATGARAFALGPDIFIAPEHYAPDTPHGRHLIGHELCHVVQQRQRRVWNPLGFGVAVVHDPALETEAERAGQRLRHGMVPRRRGVLLTGSLRDKYLSNVLQCAPFDYDEYKKNEPITDPDKIKILDQLKVYQRYLTDPDFFKMALNYLEGQLVQAKVNGTKKILSNELADKEVSCGLFNPGVNIYYQVLSEDAFKHLTTRRMQFKDVGAGFVHGEYTHRIQWYVCIFHQSEGFKNDQYIAPLKEGEPPLRHQFIPSELFEFINTFGLKIHKRHWPRQQVSGGGFLWDTLFDRNSTDVGENDGITSPEVFNKTLFQEDLVPKIKLGSSGIGTRADKYPTLSSIVTQRYLKRTGNMARESNEELIEYAKRKYEKHNSKYRTLVDEIKEETLEAQLAKGVLIPR